MKALVMRAPGEYGVEDVKNRLRLFNSPAPQS